MPPLLPALALLEFSSIAAGTRAADAIAKKAPVTLVRVGTLQPGKFAILFAGDVASVEESFAEGRRRGESALVDSVLLPDVHPAVSEAVLGTRGDWGNDALGIIETPTLAAILQAADAAMKGANVSIAEIRLGDGLGGKGLAYFGGLLADVQAAVEIGCAALGERRASACVTVIPRLDEDVRRRLEPSTRFGQGW
ncbi:MAG TPA: BMC domain-containing protein [Phycisphaerae bacterium]|nr:BMC domain-containing protein [Phycisphaerae bacterium]